MQALFILNSHPCFFLMIAFIICQYPYFPQNFGQFLINN